MADHLRRYRESTLGELLQAQSAAQAAIDSLPDPVVAFDAAGSVLAANQVAERDLKITMESGPGAVAAVRARAARRAGEAARARACRKGRVPAQGLRRGDPRDPA